MSRIFSGFLFVLALAAQPADIIWSARYVITMDAQRRVIENGAVAIKGDRILAVSTKADIDARFQAKQRLDRPDAILAPGLINTHTHAAVDPKSTRLNSSHLGISYAVFCLKKKRIMNQPTSLSCGERKPCLCITADWTD